MPKANEGGDKDVTTKTGEFLAQAVVLLKQIADQEGKSVPDVVRGLMREIREAGARALSAQVEESREDVDLPTFMEQMDTAAQMSSADLAAQVRGALKQVEADLTAEMNRFKQLVRERGMDLRQLLEGLLKIMEGGEESMTCEGFTNLIKQEAEPTPEQVEAAAKHLRGCPHCQAIEAEKDARHTFWDFDTPGTGEEYFKNLRDRVQKEKGDE